MPGSTRTQIYLTADQRAAIDALMEREGKSLALIVREALDQYLAPPKSDLGAALDAAFGALPDLEVPPRSEWNRFPLPKPKPDARRGSRARQRKRTPR